MNFVIREMRNHWKIDGNPEQFATCFAAVRYARTLAKSRSQIATFTYYAITDRGNFITRYLEKELQQIDA